MNITEAKEKLLSWARAQVGTKEGYNNYNQYAAMPEMTQLLGWNAQNQPWCNIFVNAAFISVFGLEKGAEMLYQPMGAGSALCSASAGFFEQHHAFVKTQPEPGDVIFFLVGGSINHMGIVNQVDSNLIYTIEGNSGDEVAERMYAHNSYKIAGYGVPQWNIVIDGANDDDKPECDGDACDLNIPLQTSVNFPVLRNGMGGNWVAAAQGVLYAKKYSLGPYGVDGEFGPATQAAVRNFQVRNGLKIDGIIGDEMWPYLLPNEHYS